MSRLLILTLALISLSSASLDVWLSTGDSLKKLRQESPLSPNPSPGPGLQVTVNLNVADQIIEGFGAAISNSAAYLLYNAPNRAEILSDLFDPSSGIGISYIRLVMGGSDFNAVTPYTYNDMPAGMTDFPLDFFSIDNDRQFVIPVLKEILAVNSGIKIMASPWSAPAWMKTSGSLNGGQLRSGSSYMTTYAEYFIRFLEAYIAEGIHIDAITPQNEPMHEDGGYPTMRMDWTQQRDFIKGFLGPALALSGLSTKLIIFDHNWDMAYYPDNILNDSEAAAFVDGSAWHCYGGDRKAPQQVRNNHPSKDIYFTECSGGTWDEHFGSSLGWNTQNLFIGQTRVGARTVLLWNMALDENHGPRVGVSGGCSNCRGVVTVKGDGSYDRNIEYYAIGHFSKFIRPGARRIESTTYESDDFETAAFLNQDGSTIVVVLNAAWGATTKTFSININGQYYNYANLPSRSVISFIYRP